MDNITELSTKSVPRLLWQYALPAIIAMTATSILNIADSYFIGNYVGGYAIGGMTATLPFMNLATAFGAMVGVGAGSVISIRLGQKDYHTANRVMGNAMTLNLIIGLGVTFVCLAFLDPLLYLFGATDNSLPFARSYMSMLLYGNVFSHTFFGLNSILRATGHPSIAMQCNLLAVTLNCVLDYVFMVHLGMGIQGVAQATVISQIVALVWQFHILSKPTEVIYFQRGIYRPDLRIIRQILSIGASPFLMNACACIVVLFINNQMLTYGSMLPVKDGGDVAVAAYGIDNRVVFCFLMIVMGLNQGMQPIAGYNWGARQDHRVWHVLRLTILGGTLVTLCGWVVGTFFAEEVVRCFVSEPDVVAIATHGFRIDVAVFPIVGAQMVISNFFQSIGHAGKSVFLSLSRQLLVLVPALWLLPQWMGFDGVWWAIPVSDMVSFIFALGMFIWLVRHIKQRKAKARTAQ
ncbi:MAG: MATE family efflux transporter [Bacteroidaceae bacterium]|nr:MATE family efflux transporter [Bacteroidaceae bacterium]